MTLDTSFFDQLDAQLSMVEAQADALQGEAAAELAGLRRDLQEVIDKSFPGLKAQYADMVALEAQLAPALALLSMSPTDLGSVISFITNLVEHYLAPQLQPYYKTVTQITETTARIATLVSRIESVASKLRGFSPSIPSFP